MSLTFDSGTAFSHSGSATSITSGALTVAAGDLVVLHYLNGDSTNSYATSVADSLGNSWSRITASRAFNASLYGGTSSEIWWSVIAGGGSMAVTVNCASGGGYQAGCLARYVGGSSVSLDVATGNYGATVPGLSVTTAIDGDLIISACSAANAVTYSNMTDRSAVLSEAYADTIQGAHGAFAESCSGTSGQWVGSMAAFAAGGSRSAQPTICVMQ